MSSPYLCIGGPADGKYRAMEEGCDRMRVAELPPAPTVAYSAENASEPAKHCAARTHNYYLAVSKRYGFVWVHEDYKGVIK